MWEWVGSQQRVRDGDLDRMDSGGYAWSAASIQYVMYPHHHHGRPVTGSFTGGIYRGMSVPQLIIGCELVLNSYAIV